MPDNKTINGAQSTDEKMQELFDLLNEKAEAGELDESAELPQEEVDDSPMSSSETSAYEYSLMMKQYEAMLLDYQRREAEEAAEQEAAEKAEEQLPRPSNVGAAHQGLPALGRDRDPALPAGDV